MGIFTPDYEVIGGARLCYPTAPAVQLCLKTYISGNNGVALSPHLMTEREIDDQIDARIAELQALRPKLKTALREAR